MENHFLYSIQITCSNTPNKQREQRKASKYNNLRSDSPDSTSRNTPIKPNLIAKDTPIGAKDVKHPGSSSDEVDKSSTFSTIDEKGPKLRLKSRKRNRYTEVGIIDSNNGQVVCR